MQIAVNATYTTFYYDYQYVMHKSVECRQNAAKVCMGSAQEVFRSVRAHSFQNLDHLALLRAYNVHTMLQLRDALARWCVDGAPQGAHVRGILCFGIVNSYGGVGYVHVAAVNALDGAKAPYWVVGVCLCIFGVHA